MAALTPQAIELRDVILPLVGLSNAGPMASRQTVQFMALHGLSSIEDFNLIEPHQAKELVKASNGRHPAQSMGILVQNNLTGLLWYVKDRTRRGLLLDPNMVTLVQYVKVTWLTKPTSKIVIRVRTSNPSRNGTINSNSTIGIGRSRRPCPLCMGGTTALLRTLSGLTGTKSNGDPASGVCKH